MVLRRLFYALINNAQVVEKLSESRPIRRAAQITAFAIAKAQIAGKDESRPIPTGGADHDLGRRATRLRDTFVKEVKEGTRDASRPIQDRK
uniref:Si:ch211-162e15.3 n=1 Tax=Sinocyclocheilus anshuiensis TaxID=1608454 RepID=A0A671R7D7_9TELE